MDEVFNSEGGHGTYICKPRDELVPHAPLQLPATRHFLALPPDTEPDVEFERGK